jgi:hypothetical protein
MMLRPSMPSSVAALLGLTLFNLALARPLGAQVNPNDRAAVVNHYNSVYLPALRNGNTGWTGSTAGCQPGTLAAQFVADTLLTINTFRSMAGLPSVTFGNPRSFATTNPNAPVADSMQGVLMLEAAGQFTHNLPPNGPCGTQAGSDALVTSNLTRFNVGPAGVLSLMTDASLPNVDHRRWMMHESLQQMALGATPQFMAINVMGPQTPGPRTRFSAWPPAGFVPYQWCFDTWSFAVPAVNQVPTQPSTWADFSNAVVTVTRAGTPVPVTYSVVVNSAYDNAMVWRFATPPTHGAGMTDTPYTVTISNVGRSAQSTYTYTVTIIDAGSGTPDECAGAIGVQNGTNGPFDNHTATDSTPRFACVSNAGNDVWFSYRATCTGTTTFSTCSNATFDTALEVFGGTCSSLVSLGCSDDLCGSQSQVTITTVAGTDYRVRVGGYGVERGTFTLVITTANCGGGSFQTLRHGCGAATIGYTGNAAIGAVTTFSLSGVTATPVVFLGLSLLNAPLCPACVLGANPDVVVPGATLPLTIPNNSGLVGARLHVQGADVGASAGCATPRLTVTDTVTMTIG